MPAAPPPPSPSPQSRTERTLSRLRELLLAGALAPGERLGEVALAARLGASRTPIRAALARLAQEGLLQPLPAGGYAVRTFSPQDVADAIELRGTLEGLAARLAAERGAAPALLQAAALDLDAIDAVLASPALDDHAFARYVQANARFHALLARMPASATLQAELQRVTALPFASPSAFVVVQAHSPGARDMLYVAQDQHRRVLDAIAAREGTRAEALMREHSRIAQRNLQAVLQGDAPAALAGAQLLAGARQPA